MDGCECSIEIVMVNAQMTLKFVEIIMLRLKELLKQLMIASSPVKIKTILLKEWMSAILSVAKTYALLQRMTGFNYNGEIKKLPLKDSNA